MNKTEFELLYNLIKLREQRISENDLKDLFYKHRETVSNLKAQELIDEMGITTKGLQKLEKYKVKNAIILAAGMSTRFAPISFDVAKGLLPVKGERLIERQIRQIKERGINEIIIVVGYHSEEFKDIIAEYSLIEVYNPFFAERNNYYSVYLCRDYLSRTLVTSSDLYFTENVFENYAYDSFYTSVFIDEPTEERALELDKDDKMIGTKYGNYQNVWVTLGYAFFDERFSQNYIDIVEKNVEADWIQSKFWADIQDMYLKELYMYIKRCNRDEINEFDYMFELKQFDREFCGVQYSPTYKKMCSIFLCTEDELYDFQPLLINGTGRFSCSFKYRDELYMYITKDILKNANVISQIIECCHCKELTEVYSDSDFGTVFKGLP